jgi:arsenite methyltransferase
MEKNIFDFQAAVGVTKHLGSLHATNELIRKCGITRESYVLDVGCGVGQTAVYLAQRIGCRVMGVDVLPQMVTQTRQRVEKEGLQHLVEARIADVQALPFEDNTFDDVLTESVMAFPANKEKAMAELVRVCKPGGQVGLNETTWLKIPVPEEMAAWVAQELSSHAEIYTADGWLSLIAGAGLTNISMDTYRITGGQETLGNFQRYGCGYILKAWGRTFSVYRKDPVYREMLDKVKKTRLPKGLFEYFGYGIYIGSKVGI